MRIAILTVIRAAFVALLPTGPRDVASRRLFRGELHLAARTDPPGVALAIADVPLVRRMDLELLHSRIRLVAIRALEERR